MKVDLGNYFFDDTDSIGKGNYSIVYKGYNDSTKNQYWILNWDKFNQPTLVNKLSKLGVLPNA